METNKIYQGDCLELMKQLEDKSVDLILVDPPYEMKESNLIRLREVIKKKIKQNGSIWVFARYKYVAEIKVLFSKCFEFVNWIIWYKGTRGSSNNKFTNSHDDILFFTNSKKYTFNLDTIREPYSKLAIDWYNKYGGVYDYKKVSRLNPKGKNPTDVWKINFLQGNSEEYLSHPHQKPLKLINKIIQVSSNEDDVVLDCFMGSGTTAIACINTNRNFIGMELSEEYCKIANDRIKQLQQQQIDGVDIPLKDTTEFNEIIDKIQKEMKE